MRERGLKWKILNILLDREPHRSDEITRELFGTAETTRTGLFRLGARINDIKEMGYDVRGWHDPENRKFYWYKIVVSEQQEMI